MLALQITKLKKIYTNGLCALDGIDLALNQGDFFALLGPNGAGKSTIIGIICGLVNKTSGAISIFGYDADKEATAAKMTIGVVPQEINFSQFETCLDIIVNQAGYYGMRRSTALKHAEKYMRQLDLWGKRHECSRNLSGGMKRRLMIARALVNEPRMLVLDEPTAGVDVELRRSTWNFLLEVNRQGTTILLTTHYLEEAENLCKNIAIIDKGKIIENTSIKRLLSQLNQETFIFDLAEPLNALPQTDSFRLSLLDPTTIEAEITRTQSLNDLFNVLTERNIKVSSMRNKSNRLEELFLNLLNQNIKYGHE